MPSRPSFPVAVTIGDPAGIGPEVVLKSLSQIPSFQKKVLVVGGFPILDRYNKKYKLGLTLRTADPDNPTPVEGAVAVLNVRTEVDRKKIVGTSSPVCGRAAVEYLKAAVSLILGGKVRALATAPINKNSIHKAGYSYPGHTEMLADWTGTRRFAMMFASDRLKVVLATIHLPLARVKGTISKELLEEKIFLIHRFFNSLDIKNPRIAVAGVNPHAGEEGIFGDEERKIVVPAIRRMAKKGIRVSGPFPADTLFVKSRLAEYDVVLAMYHDQGLIPAKLLAFNRLVNVTLGLPFLRTSVDHGTAFDIAGKNRANPSSMISAIRLALRWGRRFSVRERRS